jgi:hypothetical protein
MDIIVEADIYTPNIDDKGNYVDKIPSFNNIKNGLRCPCGTRKDKTYDCTSYFSNHIKTQTHKKWLNHLNTNKTNYYTENIQLKDTLTNQKLVIARLQKENDENIKFIAHLTKKMEMRETNSIVEDLLNFD